MADTQVVANPGSGGGSFEADADGQGNLIPYSKLAFGPSGTQTRVAQLSGQGLPTQSDPGALWPAGKTALAAAGFVSVRSIVLEKFKIISGAACNFYRGYVINPSNIPGMLLALDAATLPADGAVTPLDASPIYPGGVANFDYGNLPERCAVGLVLVLSARADTPFVLDTSNGALLGFFRGSTA